MPRPSRPSPSAASALLLALLVACSPAFNWREVRLEAAPLRFLLPCKPDKAEKLVPMGGGLTRLRMLGCEAAGVTFAVSVADIGDAAKADAVLQQWKDLTLANMKAAPVGVSGKAAPATSPTNDGPRSQVSEAKVVGALAVPGAPIGAMPFRVTARGQRLDGTPVDGEAVYFSQGPLVFQAVMYATHIDQDLAETFLTSLTLQP